MSEQKRERNLVKIIVPVGFAPWSLWIAADSQRISRSDVPQVMNMEKRVLQISPLVF